MIALPSWVLLGLLPLQNALLCSLSFLEPQQRARWCLVPNIPSGTACENANSSLHPRRCRPPGPATQCPPPSQVPAQDPRVLDVVTLNCYGLIGPLH